MDTRDMLEVLRDNIDIDEVLDVVLEHLETIDSDVYSTAILNTYNDFQDEINEIIEEQQLTINTL